MSSPNEPEIPGEGGENPSAGLNVTPHYEPGPGSDAALTSDSGAEPPPVTRSQPLALPAELSQGGSIRAVGRYELVQTLGAGGMGVVYEGIHRELRKRVAVKVLHPPLAEARGVRARFLREGQAASRVRHPNVVDVYDVGVEGEVPYLVMELLEGESFAALLRRERRLSAERTVDVIVPVVAALAAAHSLGVVHRDLKPENVFLCQEPGGIRPKVLDFGISKIIDPEVGARLSGTEAFLGTPFYMSPEQAQNVGQLDARTDQYSLGVLAYEALTGRRPFEASTLYALLGAIVAGRYEPLRALAPEVPAELAAIVARAMARRTESRYPTVRALGLELLPFASERVRLLYEAELTAAEPARVSAGRASSGDAVDALRPAAATVGQEGDRGRFPRARWLWVAALGGALPVLVLAGLLARRPALSSAELPAPSASVRASVNAARPTVEVTPAGAQRLRLRAGRAGTRRHERRGRPEPPQRSAARADHDAVIPARAGARPPLRLRVRSLSWLCFAGALVATVSVAVTARADAAAEARFHDERARVAYAARDFETALAEFFVVRRLIPNPRVDFNVALCFEHLGRDAEAYMHFDGFLADVTSQAPELAELRAYAQAALERIAPRVALVEVSSQPSGATIYLDRREHGSYGQTPRTLAVAPGDHQVRIELSGYRPAEVNVVATRGERRGVALAPERILGRLEVTATVAGEVRVLDPRGVAVAKGRTPLAAELPPGPYEIEVAAVGYKPWRGVAEVIPDDRVQREAVPQPSPDAVGDLAVTSNVPGAAVALDGRPAGFSPVVLDGLTPGPHRLRVESDERVPWSGAVSVRPAERTWVTVSLDEPPRIVRSPFTWAFGGVAVTAGLAGAAVATLAAVRHADFESAAPEDQAALRHEGRTLNATADVLFGVATASLVTSVTLYFGTSRPQGGESAASVARDAR